jgi:hypothetical protein
MLARRVRTDGFIDPCIPSRAAKPPVGPGWVHEIKHDGYRLIGRMSASRRSLRLGAGFPRQSAVGMSGPSSLSALVAGRSPASSQITPCWSCSSTLSSRFCRWDAGARCVR